MADSTREPERQEPETPASPEAVAEEIRETLEEIADKVEAITPETGTDTPASPTGEAGTQDAAPEAASESPVSALDSAASAPADLLSQQLELMRENLGLVHQKLDHHGDLMGTATADLRELMAEARDTLTLHQQVVGEFDQLVEGLGLIAQALTKMHREVLAALTGKPATQTPSQTSQASAIPEV